MNACLLGRLCKPDKDAAACLKQEQRHVRGVKRPCELNSISGFHVAENYSHDIMHTILEGVLPLEVGCVLYSLIDEKHLLSVDELNDFMVRFWQTITVDKKSRPSEFTKIQEPGCGLSNSMKDKVLVFAKVFDIDNWSQMQ